MFHLFYDLGSHRDFTFFMIEKNQSIGILTQNDGDLPVIKKSLHQEPCLKKVKGALTAKKGAERAGGAKRKQALWEFTLRSTYGII